MLRSMAILLLLPSFGAFGQDRYEDKGACEKQEILWQNVEATPYRRLPPVTGGWAGLLTSIRSALFLSETFSHESDVLPRGRKKVIHGSGSVAKAVWKTDANSPFSGLYRDTEACALIRLSLAAKPQSFGFTPAMAVKVLLDGRPSSNLHVMHSLNGQGDDTNFFKHTFTNHLPAPRGFVFNSLQLALAVVGRDLRKLSVDHFSRIAVDGSPVGRVYSPKQIAFVPKISQPSRSRQDFRLELAALADGTLLYEIHGLDGRGDWHLIGELSLASAPLASQFGDESLFFRHEQR